MQQDDKTVAMITNPDEPLHRMWLRPIPKRVSVTADGAHIAQSDRAVRLIEIGNTVYEPIIYLPRADCQAELIQRSERTHCPLKGEATYFDVFPQAVHARLERLAWAYPDPYPFAAALAPLIALDPARVTITETPWAPRGDEQA